MWPVSEHDSTSTHQTPH